MKTYTPIGHSMQVVETIAALPHKPAEIILLMNQLLERYGPEVELKSSVIGNSEGSMRTSDFYTASVSWYVIALKPTYSDEDQREIMQNKTYEALLHVYEKIATGALLHDRAVPLGISDKIMELRQKLDK